MKAILSQFYDGVRDRVAVDETLKLEEDSDSFILTEQMQTKITEVRNALNLYIGIIITGVTLVGLV